jgi:hypothetical protein
MFSSEHCQASCLTQWSHVPDECVFLWPELYTKLSMYHQVHIYISLQHLREEKTNVVLTLGGWWTSNGIFSTSILLWII